MPTVKDRIDDAKQTADAKLAADNAAVAADNADANAEASLLAGLLAVGPVGVIAPDGLSITVYRAAGSPPALDTLLVPLASTVTAPTAPAPTAPAPTAPHA